MNLSGDVVETDEGFSRTEQRTAQNRKKIIQKRKHLAPKGLGDDYRVGRLEYVLVRP